MDLTRSAERWLGQMRRAGLPVLPPVQAFAELVAVILLLLALDWLLPGFDLASFQPNPLWIPVLLLSLQYGTVSGLMAAGVAIAVSLFQGLPEQGIGENHFIYLLRVWAEPILWIGVAVLLGQLRMRQISERQELSRKVSELTSQRRALAMHATNLRQRCDMLELEIATRRETPPLRLLALMSDARAADVLDAEKAAACLAEMFPGGATSVFLVEEMALRRVAGTAWPDGVPWQKVVPASAPLYRAVVTAGETVSVLTAAGEAALGGEGLLATPLRDASGSVRGMLKVEQVADPSEMDAASAPALAMLAQVLGRAPATPPATHNVLPAPAPGLARAAAESGVRLLRRARILRPVQSPALEAEAEDGHEAVKTQAGR